jgi:hypothetical protein
VDPAAVALSSHQKTGGVAAWSRPTTIPHSIGARTAAGCEAGDAVAACWLVAVLLIPHVIALVFRSGSLERSTRSRNAEPPSRRAPSGR